MTTLQNYHNAESDLKQLQFEANGLDYNLKIAIENEDSKEIARLKDRQRDIPNELFAAKLTLIQREIEHRDYERKELTSKLESARKDKEETQEMNSTKAQIYKNEIEILSRETMNKMAALVQLENAIGMKARHIQELRQKLREFTA